MQGFTVSMFWCLSPTLGQLRSIKWAKIENVKIENVKIENVKIENVKIENSKIENIKIENVKIENVKIENVKSKIRCRVWASVVQFQFNICIHKKKKVK